MKKKKIHSQKTQIAEITLAIESLLSESNYKPLTKKELFHKLQFPHSFLSPFDKSIHLLQKEGKIQLVHNKIQLAIPKEKTITGTLRMHPRGFGFVSSSTYGGVFIGQADLFGAIDGDMVQAEVHIPIGPKGADGHVTAILERKRKTAVAIVNHIKEDGSYWIYIPIMGKQEKEKEIHTQEKLHKGDRILVSIHEKKNKLCFNFEKKLASIEDASKDVQIAQIDYSLPLEFPQEVLKEVAQFETYVTEKDKKGRQDFTNLLTITIDPKTAKDFDDAISLTSDQQGYHLGVHIADVAHYVKSRSHLDKEAYSRANSTYFPGEVVPMLPHELSSHLCSLKPDVERLTMSVIMDFDQKGKLLHYEIVHSFIKSQKRLSYEEAYQILTQEKNHPLYPLLSRMEKLALLLKKIRQERGSFDFTLPEPEIVVDEKGNPLRIQLHEYDISHQMIEEFMLKANETIAKHLYYQKSHVLYRIHEAPSKDNMDTFFALARSIGFPLPPQPKSTDIQKLFDKAKLTPFRDQLSIQFIRSMRLAYYSPDNIGHYGLALEHYCHFTSPIRRYSDLIAQRLLFGEGKNIDMVKIAEHVSERERISMKAESSVVLLKKLRLLKKAYHEDPEAIYQATITSIKPFGIAFEVDGYYVDGFLHLNEFWDFFRYDEKHMRLIGSKTKKIYSIGQKLKLVLKHVDLIHTETVWSPQ
jgi:ribonuclease R